MWWGYHGYGCFGFLLFILVVGFFVVRVCAFRDYRGYRRRWSDDADEILRKRLASGEISEDEYQKLKDALKR
jgi:putative membrane protein